MASDIPRLERGIVETSSERCDENPTLGAALGVVSEAVLVADASGKVVLLNEVAETLLGRTRQEVAGQSLGAVLSALTGADMTHALARAEPSPVDVRVSDADRTVWEIRVGRIDCGGDADGYVALARNVAAERQVGRRFERQERLAAMGEMAAGLAHDFSNVLTVVIGTAELLAREEELRPPIKEKLEIITAEARRASRVSRRMMELGRPSTENVAEVIDLGELLRGSIDLLNRVSPRHSVRTVSVPAGAYLIRGDPMQLEQILTNLVMNARDAMPAGGQIRVGLARGKLPPRHARLSTPAKGATSWIVLSVADDGVGMEPEVIRHVFEPFFTTKEPGEGSGLGLAQVYDLVKRHHGFVEASSAPGKGTIFELYLPAVESEGVADASDSPSQVRRGRRETLLLVEDETRVRRIVARQLEWLGYRVVPASSGQEALQQFRRHGNEIAGAIVDLVMPGMGGPMLYQALRQARPALPIVVLSAYSRAAGAPGTGLDADGRVVWIQKPATAEQLGRGVRRVLESR